MAYLGVQPVYIQHRKHHKVDFILLGLYKKNLDLFYLQLQEEVGGYKMSGFQKNLKIGKLELKLQIFVKLFEMFLGTKCFPTCIT